MTDEHDEPYLRVRLVCAYDGGSFRGFARNEGVRTVAGELEAHLSRVLRVPITVTGAGRTDKGVHAAGQVVSFDAPASRLEPRRLMRSLNSVLGPAISVRAVEVVAPEFDARFSARWRRYRYTILTDPAPDPFRAAYSWHLPITLDVDAMAVAATAVVGRHDFSSFCRRPPTSPGEAPASLERTVLDATWTRPAPGELRFEITAVAFCHQMVRSIVGTLVDVGRRRIAPDAIGSILAAGDRSAAGGLAPPEGLCLLEVGY